MAKRKAKINVKQCKACPWRNGVDPHDIPNGYSEAMHCGLRSTIAADDGPGGIMTILSGILPIMACHESPVGKERPCVGWLANQLGTGNNIGLRLWFSQAVKKGQITGPLRLVGEQHECFEDTLPKKE